MHQSSHCETPSAPEWILDDKTSPTHVHGLPCPHLLLYEYPPLFFMDYSHVRRCAISQSLTRSPASPEHSLLQFCCSPKAFYVCALCLASFTSHGLPGRFVLTSKIPIQTLSSAAYLTCPPSLSHRPYTECSCFHACTLIIFLMLSSDHDALDSFVVPDKDFFFNVVF